MDLLTIFVTGLITGGLTCAAVQGGLLAAVIAQQEEEQIEKKIKKRENIFPIISFLAAKLFVYTILGFALGLFGSFFVISIFTRVILQILVVIFMLGSALNLLNIHPLFRYFIIQPPKFLMRLTRKQSKSKDFFAPAALGAFTIFIPCGTTQVMMALAVGSANPILGAVIMFTFILGTSPVFFILGYFTTKLGEALHKKFLKIVAFAIIILAIYTLNQTLTLSGSTFTFNNLWNQTACKIISCKDSRNNQTNQETKIYLMDNGYNPQQINIKAGSHVVLNLINNNSKGCIQAFVIPELGIQTIVRYGTSKNLEFDAPNEQKQIVFTCSMGMYRGIINVE